MFFKKKIKEDKKEFILNNIQTPPLLSSRQVYGIVLRAFFPNLQEFIEYLNRLEAVLEIGEIGTEEIIIIKETIEKSEETLEFYYIVKKPNEEDLNNLDGQCLDVDYRIRKGLEMEIKGLRMLIEGVEKSDSVASQKALDKCTKAIGLLSPTVADISEIIQEVTL